MRLVAADEPVFVVAPGPVTLFFRTSTLLIRDLRGMDLEEQRVARFFTLGGELLSLVTTDGGVDLEHSGTNALAELQSALLSVADDPDADVDPTVVANQVLRNQWKGRWPRSPSWVHRLIHGAQPPSID